MLQAQAMLGGRSQSDSGGGTGNPRADGLESELTSIMLGEAERPSSILEIPSGVPFDQPEHEIFKWDVALNADDLIGLLGTFSWIITLPDETRERVIAEARRLMSELLGLEGEVTVDVAYRAEAWRSRRHT